jgi:hypothetical protein
VDVQKSLFLFFLIAAALPVRAAEKVMVEQLEQASSVQSAY